MRPTSTAPKPLFLAKAIGSSQNFADLSSRSTCTCGGSTRSWLKKYTRQGRALKIVGIRVSMREDGAK